MNLIQLKELINNSLSGSQKDNLVDIQALSTYFIHYLMNKEANKPFYQEIYIVKTGETNKNFQIKSLFSFDIFMHDDETYYVPAHNGPIKKNRVVDNKCTKTLANNEEKEFFIALNSLLRNSDSFGEFAKKSNLLFNSLSISLDVIEQKFDLKLIKMIESYNKVLNNPIEDTFHLSNVFQELGSYLIGDLGLNIYGRDIFQAISANDVIVLANKEGFYKNHQSFSHLVLDNDYFKNNYFSGIINLSDSSVDIMDSCFSLHYDLLKTILIDKLAYYEEMPTLDEYFINKYPAIESLKKQIDAIYPFLDVPAFENIQYNVIKDSEIQSDNIDQYINESMTKINLLLNPFRNRTMTKRQELKISPHVTDVISFIAEDHYNQYVGYTCLEYDFEKGMTLFNVRDTFCFNDVPAEIVDNTIKSVFDYAAKNEKVLILNSNKYAFTEDFLRIYKENYQDKCITFFLDNNTNQDIINFLSNNKVNYKDFITINQKNDSIVKSENLKQKNKI